VNPRYRNVYVNRDVIRRRVEYRNVDRYPGVHRDTRFSRGPVVIYRDNRSRGYDAGTVYDNGRRPDQGSRYDTERRDAPQRARDDYRNDRPRSAEDNRNDDNRDRDRQRTVYEGWNGGRDQQSRDNRSTNAPAPERTDRDRGPVHVGMWGSEGSRAQAPRDQQQQQQQPSRDQRGGERDGRGPSRDGARQPDPVRPSNAVERNEMPMINPRRAEPREQGRPEGAPQGVDRNPGNGQRSPRGGVERERPKV
jgi:hypothetical protein